MVFVGKILPIIFGIVLALIIAGIVIVIVRQIENNNSDQYEKRDN
ncbi:MAG: hypothetical protein PHE08_08250 [Bacteroidales bacterium]|jgi:hypothetical protein|nr:hypothetical protein [Bacteroidales bacterium]MDY0160220.1 hypothetical protein [Bacteroidales bacterium]